VKQQNETELETLAGEATTISVRRRSVGGGDALSAKR
jgi:hypothetical protein